MKLMESSSAAVMKSNRDGTESTGFAPTKRTKKKAKASKQPGRSRKDTKEAAEDRGRRLLEEMRAKDSLQRKEFGETNRKERIGPFVYEKDPSSPIEQPVDPTEGVMPEVVSNRIVQRVLVFAGVPIGLGVVSFVGFFIATTQLGVDILPQVVAYSTQALLLLSFAGISYGVLSASWDEEKEGSKLGWENVGPNIAAMRGQEDARIAEARRDAEEADAAAAGILMGSRKAQRTRDQQD